MVRAMISPGSTLCAGRSMRSSMRGAWRRFTDTHRGAQLEEPGYPQLHRAGSRAWPPARLDDAWACASSAPPAIMAKCSSGTWARAHAWHSTRAEPALASGRGALCAAAELNRGRCARKVAIIGAGRRGCCWGLAGKGRHRDRDPRKPQRRLCALAHSRRRAGTGHGQAAGGGGVVAERLHREGLRHDGFALGFDRRRCASTLRDLTGGHVTSMARPKSRVT